MTVDRQAARLAHERRLRLRAERSLRLLWGSRRVRSAWSRDRFDAAVADGSLKRMLEQAEPQSNSELPLPYDVLDDAADPADASPSGGLKFG